MDITQDLRCRTNDVTNHFEISKIQNKYDIRLNDTELDEISVGSAIYP